MLDGTLKENRACNSVKVRTLGMLEAFFQYIFCLFILNNDWTTFNVDDSMAIMMAFQSPELQILGLTTIFGNVSTENATRNALLLVCVSFVRYDVLLVFCYFVPSI